MVRLLLVQALVLRAQRAAIQHSAARLSRFRLPMAVGVAQAAPALLLLLPVAAARAWVERAVTPQHRLPGLLAPMAALLAGLVRLGLQTLAPADQAVAAMLQQAA